MYPGQDNSGLSSVVSSQPMVFDEEQKKSKRRVVVIIVAMALILVAIIVGMVVFLMMNRARAAVGKEVNAYIEYFAYGTEGGENQITNETFAMDPETYAIATKMQNISAKESSEYLNKLLDKYNVVETNGKNIINNNLLKYNRLFLNFYGLIAQSLYSDLLIKSYNNEISFSDLYEKLNVGDDSFLASVKNVLNAYVEEQNKIYTRMSEWGCLNGEKIDYNCIIASGNGNEIYGDDGVDRYDKLEQDNSLIYNTLVGGLSDLYEQGGEK